MSAPARPSAAEPGNEPDTPGAVYAMTNEPTGNRVVMFNRAADGTLTPGGSFPTGGMGSGQFEGSAGGLILTGQSPDNLGGGNRYLLATNTGSNEITLFAVKKDGLVFLNKVSSGGVQPVSLTLRKNLLYVLNQASGTINGFRVGPRGELTPLPGSERPVTGGGPADTAQVAFTPAGDVLVVTGKNTNIIDTYVVDQGTGLAAGPIPNQASGVTPFGFTFTQRGQLVTSESFQGAQGQGAAASYEVPKDGVLIPISGTIRNNQSDTCWVVITDNQKYAYVTNAMSGDVSSYLIEPDGALVLLNPIAGSIGVLPIDEAFSQNSRYLYVRSLSDGHITSFRVETDGSLTPIQTLQGLPPGAIGLAAR
jgi:6-phosphogluconolactonase (cycloisomerase 2 family)